MKFLSFLDPFYLQKRCTFYCEPTTLAIAAIALSAAGTGATLVGQRQAAKAQAGYQQELAKSTNEAARVQAEQVRDQQAQSAEAAGREVQKASIASRQAQSTATVSAGEGGVTGNSVDALLRDFRTQEGIYKEAVTRQQQLTNFGAGQQIDAIRAGAKAGNLQMNAPIAQPNYLAAALSFGAQAAGTYAIAKRDSTGTQKS